MAEGPDNLVLVLLRRIDERLDRIEFDVHEIKVRMTAVEEGLNSLNRRVDRLEDRMLRIEKRLELVGPAGFSE